MNPNEGAALLVEEEEFASKEYSSLPKRSIEDNWKEVCSLGTSSYMMGENALNRE